MFYNNMDPIKPKQISISMFDDIEFECSKSRFLHNFFSLYSPMANNEYSLSTQKSQGLPDIA